MNINLSQYIIRKYTKNLVPLVGTPNIVFSSMCFGNVGLLNFISLGIVVSRLGRDDS